MFENFTDLARRAVVLAQEEARALGHGDVGPEHLLLALTRDDSIASRALLALGADSSAVAGTILAASDRESARRHGSIPFTPASRNVMTDAQRIASGLGSNHVNPEHLLFALTNIDEPVLAAVLRLLAIRPDEIQVAAGTLLANSGTYVPKAEREAAGQRSFTVYVGAAGAVQLQPGAGLARAQFTLHPGELLSIRDGGAIDESVRFLDYGMVRAVAEQRGADVVIVTSRQTVIEAVDAGGELVKVGEATVWSPVEIADRLVPAGA